MIAEGLTPGKRNTARILSKIIKVIPKMSETYSQIVT